MLDTPRPHRAAPTPAVLPPRPTKDVMPSAEKAVPGAEMQREALFRKLNWHRWALPSLGLHSGVHLLGQGLAASVTLGQVSLAKQEKQKVIYLFAVCHSERLTPLGLSRCRVDGSTQGCSSVHAPTWSISVKTQGRGKTDKAVLTF